ncbi:hypothetical protein C2E23DRAFT_886975 [Lenzites betulinus]|nr:hypothetical protein C2E23DRAFT_886975 [Lenzites betulinus]
MFSLKLKFFVLAAAVAVIGMSSATLAAPTPEDAAVAPLADCDPGAARRSVGHIESCWL